MRDRKKNTNNIRYFILTAVFVVVTLTGCKSKVSLGVPPETPTDVRRSEIDHTEGKVTIFWEPSLDPGKSDGGSKSSIMEYVVEYSTDNFKTNRYVTTGSGADHAVLEDLKINGKEYKVRVYAKNNSKSEKNKSDYSEVISFKVGKSSPPATPLEPKGSHVVIRPRSISLTFVYGDAGFNNDGTPANISTYRGVAKAEGKESVIGSFNDGTLSFEGLEPGTKYSFEVYAVSDSDNEGKRDSEKPLVFDLTTLSNLAKPPGAVINPSIIVNGVVSVSKNGVFEIKNLDDTIEVKWEKPNIFGLDDKGNPATIKSYDVKWSTDPNFVADVKDLEGSGLKRSYGGSSNPLVGGQTYYIRIVVVNSGGAFSPVTDFTLMTKNPFDPDGKSRAPSEPQNFVITPGVEKASFRWIQPIRLTSRSKSSKRLNFGVGVDGKEINTGDYDLEVSSDESFSETIPVTFGKSGTTADISEGEKLLVRTTYHARLRSKNTNVSGGALQYSKWVYMSFKTKTPVRPGSPGDVTIEIPVGDDQKGKLKVSWRPSTEKGRKDIDIRDEQAEITKYIVYYKKTSDTSDDPGTLKSKEVDHCNGSDLSLTLTGLDDNTEYSVYVVAVNNNPVKDDNLKYEATSDKSEIVRETTKHAATKPGVPDDVVLRNLPLPDGGNQLLVLWKDVDPTGRGTNADGNVAKIIGYMIKWNLKGSGNDPASNQVKVNVFPSEASIYREYIIEGLDNDKEYDVMLTAINENHNNDNSEVSALAESESTIAVSKKTLNGENITPSGKHPGLALKDTDDSTLILNPEGGKVTLTVPSFESGELGSENNAAFNSGRRIVQYKKEGGQWPENDDISGTAENGNVKVEEDNDGGGSEEVNPVTKANLKKKKAIAENLEPGINYVFRIKFIPAIDSTAKTHVFSYSEEFNLRLPSDADMKAKPPTVDVTKRESTSIVIEVEGADTNDFGIGKYFHNGTSTGHYKIQMKESGSTTWVDVDGSKITSKDGSAINNPITAGSEIQSYKITGIDGSTALEAGKAYSLRLVAIPTVGNTARDKKFQTESREIAIAINPGVPTATNSQLAGKVDNNPTQVRLGWTKSPVGTDDKTTYEVYYIKKGDTDITATHITNGTAISITNSEDGTGIRLISNISAGVPSYSIIVDGLEANTQYKFAVRAKGEGKGNYSALLNGEATTAEATK